MLLLMLLLHANTMQVFLLNFAVAFRNIVGRVTLAGLHSMFRHHVSLTAAASLLLRWRSNTIVSTSLRYLYCQTHIRQGFCYLVYRTNGSVHITLHPNEVANSPKGQIAFQSRNVQSIRSKTPKLATTMNTLNLTYSPRTESARWKHKMAQWASTAHASIPGVAEVAPKLVNSTHAPWQ